MESAYSGISPSGRLYRCKKEGYPQRTFSLRVETEKRMDNLLTIKNLKLSFYGEQGRVPAVKGVTLSLKRGESLALVGESGCGKTALCRCIMGLHAQHAKVEEGEVLLLGKSITQLSEKEMKAVRGRDVAMIFQDPMSSLNPTFSVGKQIVEAITAHERVDRHQAQSRAMDLLRLVEISEPELRFRQYPHHFSGGMRQRIAIAIALACNPHLIIADEPTTALDSVTQDKIMQLLKKVCKDQDKGFLFVTHDLGLAETMADRIAVMKDGLIVETGRTEELFRCPQHPYTKQLLGYAAYGKGTGHFHGRLFENSKTDQCDGTPLVQVKDLTKRFSLGKQKSAVVLDQFHMNIYKGEIVGVVGPSGCGKSTLARCMMGIYTPDGGQVQYEKDCKKQMIFQDSASALNPRMTLEQIIVEPLVIQGRKENRFFGFSKQDKTLLHQKAVEMVGLVGLEQGLLVRHPYDVSGGQRQRAAIARALITDPDFIIADEPIASLDISIQAQIIHLLKDLHDQRNLTMMMIAHDLPMVKHISDRIIELGT